jgi:hypothetical protein
MTFPTKTEAEARSILCPFAKSFDAACTPSVKLPDRGDHYYGIPTCVGSECMAWEFVDQAEQMVYLPDIQKVLPEVKSGFEVTEEQAKEHGWILKPYSPAPGKTMVYTVIQNRRGQCQRVFQATLAD